MRIAPSLFLASLLASACGGRSASEPPASAPAASASVAASAPAPAPLGPDAIQAILASSDRTAADRKTDIVRHPDKLLAFMGVGPGMTVADLGAGAGYTTELLARAVGPSGKVYSENEPELVKKFLEKPWSARLAAPANKVVVRTDRPLDDPLPADAKNLDLIVNYIFYHDSVWIGTDRAKMNKAVFDALKPGGLYVVVDASAKEGHGIDDAKTLHRIEQSVVEAEVEKAGFTLLAKADFLRNPNDARDWSSSPRVAGDRLGTEDRFILKFGRP
jgi:predicted methyltransferase